MSVMSSELAANRRGVAEDGDRRALQLLIVDDDAAQRTLISLAAKQAGHAVTVVATCGDAIREVHNKRFDCVTLDLMLEDGDGTDVLKAIADSRFAGSVIVISGMDAARRIAARLYARSLGIDLQSLPKPVDLAALRIFLANLGKTALGLPVVHTWGGVAADGVAAKHRS
ncbi:response regulator [Bradyrhizobium oligotrophicum]|uniref:response regulator n=1 Tax=Bradyrhizobium oligotrophicum TaxID=44255 RepID=UPI003EB96623